MDLSSLSFDFPLDIKMEAMPETNQDVSLSQKPEAREVKKRPIIPVVDVMGYPMKKQKARSTGDEALYYCTRRKNAKGCKASIAIHSVKGLRILRDHDHEPDELELKAQLTRSYMKEEATTTSDPPQAILTRAISQFGQVAITVAGGGKALRKMVNRARSGENDEEEDKDETKAPEPPKPVPESSIEKRIRKLAEEQAKKKIVVESEEPINKEEDDGLWNGPAKTNMEQLGRSIELHLRRRLSLADCAALIAFVMRRDETDRSKNANQSGNSSDGLAIPMSTEALLLSTVIQCAASQNSNQLGSQLNPSTSQFATLKGALESLSPMETPGPSDADADEDIKPLKEDLDKMFATTLMGEEDEEEEGWHPNNEAMGMTMEEKLLNQFAVETTGGKEKRSVRQVASNYTSPGMKGRTDTSNRNGNKLRSFTQNGEPKPLEDDHLRQLEMIAPLASSTSDDV